MPQESSETRVVGRYQIYGKVASGGMATVHFGRLVGAAGFVRTVAIKRLHSHLIDDPDFLSTMIDEARLAARIHHPNVVPTIDVVSTQGELLVVMEYVRGESLAKLLRCEMARGRRVPRPIASAVVVGVLQGLHAAHEATSDRGAPLGIVHRDVSPQNILVDVDGVARVIDFGVAKAAGRLQTTREGVIKGKLGYMAPEQLSGAEVTCRADIYAASVVLWEVLAGSRLFQGNSDAELFGRVMMGAKRLPSAFASNLPRALDALVMRGLAMRPDDRFATASEMAEGLARIVPPALPTEVGAWVKEVARESLAERSVALAEIESTSGMVSVPPPDGGHKIARPAEPRPSPPVAADDAPTIASQSSRFSVVTPKPTVVGPRWPWRRARIALGLAGVAALVLGGALALLVFALGGGAQTTPGAAARGSSAAQAPSPATPRPSMPVQFDLPSPPGSAAASVSVSASSVPASSSPASPALPAPAKRPTAPPRTPSKPPAFDPASVR